MTKFYQHAIPVLSQEYVEESGYRERFRDRYGDRWKDQDASILLTCTPTFTLSLVSVDCRLRIKLWKPLCLSCSEIARSSLYTSTSGFINEFTEQSRNHLTENLTVESHLILIKTGGDSVWLRARLSHIVSALSYTCYKTLDSGARITHCCLCHSRTLLLPEAVSSFWSSRSSSIPNSLSTDN